MPDHIWFKKVKVCDIEEIVEASKKGITQAVFGRAF